jgi:hypothetical protein
MIGQIRSAQFHGKFYAVLSIVYPELLFKIPNVTNSVAINCGETILTRNIY